MLERLVTVRCCNSEEIVPPSLVRRDRQFPSSRKRTTKVHWKREEEIPKRGEEFIWDEPYLYRHFKDGIFRRCVPQDEIPGILHHFHGSPYACHFATFKTVSKILQAGFWWPTRFRDAHAYISRCDPCQRIGNISKRNEMPQNYMLEV